VFWVALGATVGVLVVRRLSRTVDQYSPEGIGRSLSSLAGALREAADVLRDAMAEREGELRAALGVGAEAVDPERARALLDDPTGNAATADRPVRHAGRRHRSDDDREVTRDGDG
jgi:hypothetical protein